MGTVFFENERNAKEFRNRKIIERKKQTILHGAGLNLEQYPYQPYSNQDPVHFLYLGRIMKEKGMDELFASLKKLQGDGQKFILDCVGFLKMNIKNKWKL